MSENEISYNTLYKIEVFFQKNPAPKVKIRLDKATLVYNPEIMVQTHIAMIKHYLGYKHKNSIKIVTPYWNRLIKVAKVTQKFHDKNKK